MEKITAPYNSTPLRIIPQNLDCAMSSHKVTLNLTRIRVDFGEKKSIHQQPISKSNNCDTRISINRYFPLHPTLTFHSTKYPFKKRNDDAQRITYLVDHFSRNLRPRLTHPTNFHDHLMALTRESYLSRNLHKQCSNVCVHTPTNQALAIPSKD